MMAIDGSFMQKVECEDYRPDTPGRSHQYICCVLNIHGGLKPSGNASEAEGTKQVKSLMRYRQKSIGSLKWFALMHIFFGFMICVSQIGPIYWTVLTQSTRDMYIYIQTMDEYGGGIWSGLVILLTGIVGVVSLRKNRSNLIVSHLVMNVFALMFAITVIVFASLSISGLKDCKMGGAYISFRDSLRNNNDDYGTKSYEVTDTPWTKAAQARPQPHTKTYFVLEEELVRHYRYDGYNYDEQDTPRFYCEAAMFSSWLCCEALMILSSVATLVVTIWLIAKNGTALCSCCKACCDTTSEDEDDESMIKLIDDSFHI